MVSASALSSAGDFGQRSQAKHVADQDAQHLAAAEPREFERIGQARRRGLLRGAPESDPGSKNSFAGRLYRVELCNPRGMFQNLFGEEMTMGENRGGIALCRTRDEPLKADAAWRSRGRTK